MFDSSTSFNHKSIKITILNEVLSMIWKKSIIEKKNTFTPLDIACSYILLTRRFVPTITVKKLGNKSMKIKEWLYYEKIIENG